VEIAVAPFRTCGRALRRRLGAAALVAVAVVGVSAHAQEVAWPAKPIRLIVPFPRR
jgi:tripartite-type tricarboxylate transporter receptor subunit TctC